MGNDVSIRVKARGSTSKRELEIEVEKVGLGQDFLAGTPAALACRFLSARSHVFSDAEKICSMDSSTGMKLGRPESLHLPPGCELQLKLHHRRKL